MNQSDIQKMRARLQARQAQHYSVDSPAWEIAGAAALALFFLIVLFI